MKEQMFTAIAALIQNGKDSNFENTFEAIKSIADHWPNLSNGEKENIRVIANAYAISVGILRPESIPTKNNMSINQGPATFEDLYR